MVRFCVLMLVTILHWGIPPSLSSSDLLQTLSLLDLFLDLYGSSHWGIAPILEFIRSFVYLLLDLFLDLCESLYRGIPLFSAFPTGSYTPLFGFAMSRADFMDVGPICRSL